MKKLSVSHVEICIPATTSIVNFMNVYHDGPIVGKLSDVVGLSILSIITYRNKNQDRELDMERYSDVLKLYIPIDEVARRGCKQVRRMAIVAIENYIIRLIYSELEKVVAMKTVRHMGKKMHTITEAIEIFQAEFGLCEEEFNYLRLQQHLVRKKRNGKKS